MHRRLKLTMLTILVVATVAAACTSAPTVSTPGPATSAAQPAANPDGEALVKERCVGCHDLSRVEALRKTEAEWTSAVQRMVGKGARLTDVEQAAVVQYLATTYAK